jgi:hypothetical protein
MNISKILLNTLVHLPLVLTVKFNELMSKVLNTFIIVLCTFSLAGSCTFRLQKNKIRLFSKNFMTNDYITVNRRIFKAASTNITDVINWVNSTAFTITMQQKTHTKVLSKQTISIFMKNLCSPWRQRRSTSNLQPFILFPSNPLPMKYLRS